MRADAQIGDQVGQRSGDNDRYIHTGNVPSRSRSATSLLRSAALPHLELLVQAVGESANLTIRTGVEARFIVSVESTQVLRVGSREGMVFPAHRLSGGLLLLAELSPEELDQAYESKSDADVADQLDLPKLRAELARIHKQGFAVNQGRSERGVVAVGVPVRDNQGKAIAGLSVSIPSVRYDRRQLPSLVATLRIVAGRIGADEHQGSESARNRSLAATQRFEVPLRNDVG